MKKIILLILLFLPTILLAQDASVAYKTNAYTYRYTKNLKLKMNCEMAEIIITKGTSNSIEIKCTYSARHANKNTATKELERHNIMVSKTLNDIYISNYFTILKGESEPQAKLKVKFEISIPDFIKIDIKNNFGSCNITDIAMKGSITQSFGKVGLQQLKADLVLKCELSDIKLSQYDGSFELHNKSGDVSVTNFEGKLLFIENSNSSIDLDGIANSVNTKLVLNNCQLQCKHIDYQKHAVNIDSYKESINNNQNFIVEKKGNNFTVKSNTALPGFIIKALYTKINLY
jgi:hypothetical protein